MVNISVTTANQSDVASMQNVKESCSQSEERQKGQWNVSSALHHPLDAVHVLSPVLHQC